ncbi:MAG: DUF7948 domain-containing protein, partial [Bacteroidia bacterium]
WDDDILYQGSAAGWASNIYFKKDQLSFGFCRYKDGGGIHQDPRGMTPEDRKDKSNASRQEYLVWNMHFKNANQNSVVSAEGKQESHVNYLIGNDESKFKTNVPDYTNVKYDNIYDNIDVNYYSKGKNLEYDLTLKPNADISQIQMQCEGIDNIQINNSGQLEIVTQWGTLLQEIPESYQVINGQKKLVKINYRKIDKTTFGFKTDESYNDAFALVIDPVNFAWSTFVGGGPGGDAYISDIAVDAAGNVYGTGWCNAVFPATAGAYDQTYNGGGGYGDAYVFKLNPSATTLIYSTFLGGATSYEQGEGIQVNAAGQVFVAGWTQSTDFPTTAGAFGTAFHGTSFQDIFITKLNAAGSGLVYSNLIGGIYSDYAYALEINAAGEAYITGYSTNFNLDFPTTAGAYLASAATSNGGVYMLRLNAAGTGLVASTFTGNPSGRGYGLAIDAAGAAYIAEECYGNLDTTAGAYRTTPNAMIGIYPDVAVQKINATGTTLVYSTYLGGSNNDDIYYGDGITTDAAGNAYVFGYTSSIDFPTTPGAFDVTQSGGSDPFLTKLNPAGTALVYSTFVGQDGVGESVAVNAAGEAFVAGNINSQGFTATACAYDATWNGGTDCFVGKINAAGSNALYLSYFGGTGNDYGNGPFGKVKLILSGPCQDQVYVCTTSHSLDFPTTPGTYQPVKLNGGPDQPVVFHLKPTVTPNFTDVVSACNTVTFTDATTGTCIWQSGPWTPSSWSWSFGDGGTSTLQNPVHTYGAAGTYPVKLIVSCPRDSITINVTVSSSGLTLSTSSTPTGCSGSTGTATVNVVTGTGPFTYSWAPSGGTAATASALAAGTYTVTVSAGACINTATAIVSSSGTPPVTSAITGTSPVCANATGITYSVTNTVGSTYAWSVPAGASIVSGAGTNSIVVNWGTTGGTITCTETNACGAGTPVTINVTVTTPAVATFSYPGSPYCQNASNPSPTFSGGGVAGTFTSTAGLSINSSTGLVNLSASTTGTYTITNTIAASGGCPAVTATTSITINPVQNASFTYPTSTFCQSGTNPAPTITGTAGGTFSSSPAGLVFVSTGTGVINLAATALNTYTITYTTPGPCANTSNVTVTVTTAPVATFSFTGSPYCMGAANPFPTFSGGASAGVFSAAPAGLVFVSTSTGQVDLSASTAGTYTVTNTIAASGGCAAATASSTITITAPQVATFSYTGSPYCQSGTNPSPVFSGGGVAGTFTSAAGLSINAATGVVNLSASTTGTYTVTNTIAASGGCPAVSATATITIIAPQVATFNYAGGPFCQNGVSPFPTYTGGGVPGTFTGSPSGIVVDPVDGDVDLTLSTPGTYTVTNTLPASGSCPSVSATTTITITPLQNAGFTYPSGTLCVAGTSATPTITGVAGGIFTATPTGLTINSSTGIITPSTNAINSYSVTYTTPGPCPNTSSFSISITTAPVATFSFTGTPYCQSGTNPSPTFSGGGSAGTFTASPAGLSINASTGLVNLSASTPGTYTVTNTISASGGCPAATATSSITINAPQVATFNYPGTPYCQSAANPSPTLTAGAVAGAFSSTGGLIINPSTGLINLSASVAGTYTVTNTIPASGGCPTITATSSVVIVAMPNVTVNSPGICSGQTATLTATGATTYTWSTTATTSSINVTPATTATYTVIGNTSGCLDTATATVTINPSPTASGTGATVCSGSTINLSSAGGGTYSWTGPNSFTSTSQNPNIMNATIADAGNYIVTVSNGTCTDTAMVAVVVNPAPSIITTGSTSIMLGSSTPLTASGGTSYAWSPATGLSCTNCANPIATPIQTTTYCVQVSNGTCSDSSCVTVNVEMPCPDVTELQVPDAFSPNGDANNDLFILQGWSACMKEFKIYIYDRWGEKVFESVDANFNWDGTYHGKTLDPAVFVYYIKATFVNDVSIERKGNITLIR